MSRYTLNDIPVKTAFGAAQKNAAEAKVPTNLYQLLLMINGVRTVGELLRLGIRGTSLEAFDTLYRLQLIEGPKGASHQRRLPASEGSKPVGSSKGLAEARFAVLDILLDLSEKDFGARPWIEKIERTESLARLSAEVEAFCSSPFGQKYRAVHAALRRAASP